MMQSATHASASASDTEGLSRQLRPFVNRDGRLPAVFGVVIAEYGKS